jgi:hypothetical protein
MQAMRQRLWMLCQVAFWGGFTLGLVSPLVTLLGAASIGAGHGNTTTYYAGLTLSVFAWSLFVGSFVGAATLWFKEKSHFEFLIISGLAIVGYPALWYWGYMSLFS